MQRRPSASLAFLVALSVAALARAEYREISREALRDQIYGGWVGMLIGGLEGLPHEFKYKELPRATLPEFTFLPNGGERLTLDGQPGYRIRMQEPRVLEKLPASPRGPEIKR